MGEAAGTFTYVLLCVWLGTSDLVYFVPIKNEKPEVKLASPVSIKNE